MRAIPAIAKLSILGLLSVTSASLAYGSAILVGSTDVISAAGNQSGSNAGTGGADPVSVSASGFSSFTFTVTGGPVTLNGGYNNNDADGIGSASNFNGSASGSISGISLPNAGALLGVFIGPGGPTGAAPASLNFNGDTNFTSLSPLLDQLFFIGDGLTGDGTGSLQTFNVPTGASQLYLGFADACGYNGAPSCYSDNAGGLFVAANGATASIGGGATPEPSSYLLLGTGFLCLLGAGAVRRQDLAAVASRRA